MTERRIRIGELLVEAKLLTQAQLEEALGLQKQDGRRLGTLLVERGYVDESQVTQILSHQLSVPWVSLLHVDFSRQLLNLVPREVAERFMLVPIYVRHVRGQGQTLYVAMDDPSNEEALEACRGHAGLPVKSMIAPPSDIAAAIRVYYAGVPAAAAAPQKRANFAATLQSEEAFAPLPAPAAAPRVEVVRAAERTDAQPSTQPAAVHPPPPQEPPLEPPLEPELPPETVVTPPPVIAHRDETPSIEARELDLPPPSSRRTPIPRPKGAGPRMVSLTLLDGTVINLPAREAPDVGPPSSTALTGRDVVSMLRAVADGADATEVEGGPHELERIVAALLSLVLRKRLVADWEFVEELEQMRGGGRPGEPRK